MDGRNDDAYHCPMCGRVMGYENDMSETREYTENDRDMVRLDHTWYCEVCDCRLHVVDRYEYKCSDIEVL